MELDTFFTVKAMRAIYRNNFEVEACQQDIDIHDENYHHLTKVVRIQKGEKVIILNGRGLKGVYQVKLIDKKSIILSYVSHLECQRQHNISIAVGVTKKAAVEEVLSNCVELGVKSIYFVETEFSQRDFNFSPRAQKIIETALIQSNNYFMPGIVSPVKFEEMLQLSNQFDRSYVLCSDVGNRSQSMDSKTICAHKNASCLFWIGPEGGFSISEEKQIENSGATCLSFSLPILRTPTAISVAVGYELASLILK